IFFFSSRRRHTISKRDWSSDVCSSDLASTSVAPVVSTPLAYVNVTSSAPSSAFALFSFPLASSSLPPQAVRTIINTSMKKLLIHLELGFVLLAPCFVIDFSNRLHFCIKSLLTLYEDDSRIINSRSKMTLSTSAPFIFLINISAEISPILYIG